MDRRECTDGMRRKTFDETFEGVDLNYFFPNFAVVRTTWLQCFLSHLGNVGAVRAET